jgi:hypothetical protein
MSMIGYFLLVEEQRLQSLLAEPTQVHTLCDEGYSSRDEMFVDVDKAWHCMHFLLTGTADAGEPPLDFILCGGEVVGDEDVGYGPARAFMPADLQQIAKALNLIDREALAARFDPAQMDRLEIYPDAGHWSDFDPRSEETFGYYLGAFDAVKVLALRGFQKGYGMLVWLS